VVGLFVGAVVVTAIQFFRRKDWRLLLLLTLFSFLAEAQSLEWWNPWRNRLHIAAGLTGLALVLTLVPRGRSSR